MMKRCILTVAAGLMLAGSACAQDKYYGAKEGGFAISFGADPVINFVGNMFNGTTDQRFDGFKGLGSDLFNGATITGKYMLKDNVAIDLGIGFNNEATKNFSYNDPSNSDKKTNINTKGDRNFMLKAGVQYLLRPGKRLQPIMGLDIAYCHSNGYERNEDNTDGGNTIYKSSPAHTFGLLANVGVEYYITTNISLSATMDLGICKTWTKGHYENSGDKDSEVNHVVRTDYGLKTGQFGGNLGLNFYF